MRIEASLFFLLKPGDSLRPSDLFVSETQNNFVSSKELFVRVVNLGDQSTLVFKFFFVLSLKHGHHFLNFSELLALFGKTGSNYAKLFVHLCDSGAFRVDNL